MHPPWVRGANGHDRHNGFAAAGSGRRAGPERVTPIAHRRRARPARLHEIAERRRTVAGHRRPDRPGRRRGSDSAVDAAGSGRRSRCRNCRHRRAGPRTGLRSRWARRSTSRPSAVTTSALIRLSQTKPNLRSSHPLPLPSARPAMPVVGLRPPVIARPCARGRVVELAPVDSGLEAAGARDRVDR